MAPSREEWEDGMKQAAIACLRMKIDHLSYDDGSDDDASSANSPEKGSLNVLKCVGGTVKAEDGEPMYLLKLSIAVEPEAGCTYFASVTGMFAASSSDASEEEIQRALDTIGVSELYAFARDRIAMLRQGAPHQKVLFPLLEMG